MSADKRADKELVIEALRMHINWIQTSDPTLTPQDLKGMGKPEKINILGLEQMHLVARLEKLSSDIEKL